MSGLLANRSAIVTGGAHGIGRAIAVRFAAEGAVVAVVDRDEEIARDVASRIDGHAFVCDVGDPDSLARVLAGAIEALGGLTVLVNNAGVGMAGRLERYTDDQWRRLLAVNLDAAFVATRECQPALHDAGRDGDAAAIVNVAGLTATRPNRGEAPYSAAKAGLVSLTKTAALELAPNIRVNAVSPGYAATRLTAPLVDDLDLRRRITSRLPAGRIADADEVAAAVLFLASPMASYVTGVDLVVDGGASLPSHQADELMAQFLQ